MDTTWQKFFNKVAVLDEDNTFTGNNTFSGTNNFSEPNLVYEITLTAAATTISVTSLDILTDKGYTFELLINNTTVSAASYRLFFNTDTTNTNYYIAYSGYAAGAVSGLANVSLICAAMAGAKIYCRGSISQTSDTLNAQSKYTDDNGALLSVFNLNLNYTPTVTNLTQMDFTSTVASGFGIGTVLRVWKNSF